MPTTAADFLTTGIILLSSLYTALKVPVIWQQYRGQYGHLLVSLSLMSVIFGITHVGQLISLPHTVLTIIEIGAEIGVLIVIVGLGFIHPRLPYSDGDLG